MRYLILGPSEARDEADRPLPLSGQRLRALLAALALRAHGCAPVSPRTLIEEIWADAEDDAMPENAPAALQALVGRLRRALGKEAVESLPGGYRLRVDPDRDEVDLHRFERLAAEGERALADGDPAHAADLLREALALWRGPALADLPDRATAAARAEALRHAALHRRFAADLALGRAAQILPELRQLAPEHPLDEPLQVLRLRALHESGRTAEALAEYESVRRGIATRLGADPGAELRALHAELLAAGTPRPGTVAPATEPGAAPGTAPGTWAGPHTTGRGPGPGAGTGTRSGGSGAAESAGPADRSANYERDPANWSASHGRGPADRSRAAGQLGTAPGTTPGSPNAATGPATRPGPAARPGPDAAPGSAAAPGTAGTVNPAPGHGTAPAAGTAPAPGPAQAHPAPSAQPAYAEPPAPTEPPAHSAPSAHREPSAYPARPTPSAHPEPSTPAAPATAATPSAPSTSPTHSTHSTPPTHSAHPASPSYPEPSAPHGMPYRNSDRWDGDRWDGDRWGEDRWGEDRSGGTRRAPGNLRARLTSFVGREAEIAAIGTDLTGSRLVTLTGPGGSGKTRLAEEVAATAAAAAPAPYPDGTWLVELAPLDHPAAVPGAVLSALGRRVTALSTAATEGARSLGGEQDATGLLVEHLEHRTTLLVLDNCEHVIHAAATLAETLLAHCPGLTVLATSREPLGVPGEAVRPVEPLPPASAHRLFADRAAAASPGFRTGEDPAAVAEICRRLDGLPLAIELAAARLRSLTPRQIADRLDDRFRLLTSGSRTVLPRQQTLRAVVDWSWDLLDERERTVVRRLSVFAGGCTLSAAEHVCADGADDGADDGDGGRGGADNRPDDVLDLLSALVDKSILVADQPPALAGTGVRYRMLETIHDYARERAAEHADDRDAAEDRHTAQILRFATAAEPRIRSAEQLSWLPRVEADLDNIRAALHRALRARDLETLAALVRAVGWFWWLRNYRDEGSGWAKSALSLLPAAPEERTGEEELLYREFQLLDCFLLAEHRTQELLTDPGRRAVAAELVAFFRTPGPASARFPGMLWPVTAHMLEGTRGLVASVRDTVANCRRHGSPWALAVSLLFQAHVRLDLPDGEAGYAGIREYLPELDALADSTGDRWLLSQVSGLRAEIAVQEGRYEDARAECEVALRHAQQLGALTEMPVLLARIAEIWYRQGDAEQADSLARRAIADADQLGIRDAQTLAVYVRAVAAVEQGDTARARRLHLRTREYAGVGTPPAALEVLLLDLDARIAADEGSGHLPRAFRAARSAVRTAVEVAVPDHLLGHTLLTAGYVLSRAGRHALALRFADAAARLRRELPASVPELRLDGMVRAFSGAASPEGRRDGGQGREADPGGAERGAAGTAEPPLSAEEAAACLDKLCAQLDADEAAPDDDLAGDTPEGDAPEDDASDGDAPDGDAPDGDAPDDDAPGDDGVLDGDTGGDG
ncbi:BTAD domain-containing putative transcriptional regulator [Streptomyces albus]|uniref:BTAD domain-containing putative transcriptional regulator n=1 Tax=Streptomyces albus TaxID=1888 RepID=UPI0037BA03AE